MNTNEIILLISFCIVSFILILHLWIANSKIKKYKEEANEAKRSEAKIRGILSMTSMQLRNFKEGTNPYTVISKILDYFRDNL